jgi:hypothetical protein
MKRKFREDTPVDVPEPINIKRDLTLGQLAALGAAALAYNILEDQIDSLLQVATRTPDWISDEVSSRINGKEGTVEIIKRAIDHTDLPKADKDALKGLVGAFSFFKGIRDAMIHARLINLSGSIARGANRRGKEPYEVLVSEQALNGFYDHVSALQRELAVGGKLLNTALTLKQIAPDDPNKSQLEEEIEAETVRCRESRKQRQKLKQLPKFPDENELREAVNRRREAVISTIVGYRRPLTSHSQGRDNSQFWDATQMMHRRNNALLDTYYPPSATRKSG